MIQIFIGYDPKETVSYPVLSHSIISRSTEPVTIAPLALSQLGGIFTRPRDPLQSTDFSFSRFLVPYLCNYRGWAMFMDCDMLMRRDVAELWKLRDPNYAVQVVKHDYEPPEGTKFLGQVQTKYQKKNWSSVMLFNNERCRALTPEFVNTASGLELHQYKWLESDDLIGEIPASWNYLVGYNKTTKDPANVHFTIGGPYFPEYHDCEYADEWRQELERALYVEDRSANGGDNAKAKVAPAPLQSDAAKKLVRS